MQERAVSHGQLISSFTFNRSSFKVALCHSHMPLQHGDSAGVDAIFILTGDNIYRNLIWALILMLSITL